MACPQLPLHGTKKEVVPHCPSKAYAFTPIISGLCRPIEGNKLFIPAEKPLKPTLFWGVLIGLLIVVAVMLAIDNKKNRLDPYTAHVLKQSEEIQRESGVNCANLKSEIFQFFDQELRLQISSRVDGKPWVTVDQNVKMIQEKLTRIQRALTTCRTLYVLGQDGKLNNLVGLSYVDKVYQEVVLLKVYYTHGVPQECSRECLNHHFGDIRRAHAAVLMEVEGAK